MHPLYSYVVVVVSEPDAFGCYLFCIVPYDKNYKFVIIGKLPRKGSLIYPGAWGESILSGLLVSDSRTKDDVLFLLGSHTVDKQQTVSLQSG